MSSVLWVDRNLKFLSTLFFYNKIKVCFTWNLFYDCNSIEQIYEVNRVKKLASVIDKNYTFLL